MLEKGMGMGKDMLEKGMGTGQGMLDSAKGHMKDSFDESVQGSMLSVAEVAKIPPIDLSSLNDIK